MSKLNGLVFGGGGITGQIDRIIDGLRQNNCEINSSNTDNIDFIFSGNAWHKEAEDVKNSNIIKIYNTLDLPYHCNDFDFNKYGEILKKADILTCISEFVKSQIWEKYRLNAINIGYPVKDINPFNLNYRSNLSYKFLFIGRLADPNKRTTLGIKALNLINVNIQDVAFIGPEVPFNQQGIHYYGPVEDSILHSFYSSCEYLISPSKIEGLNLPVIESIIMGMIPIVCNDMTTKDELLGDIDFYSNIYPTPESIASAILFLEENPDQKLMLKEKLSELAKVFYPKFNKLTVAKKIVNCILTCPKYTQNH